ncbi:MAG: EscU/YscU/HrcU family type III secretion system export apparatus switch protein [Synergistaceae bacterium]|jgi:flagellar biosynthesis protein|nr:EscU/YscU/HrcU family type III secretion system export apparatus switch protein [Synergistaceae bacterium]
MAEKQRTGSKKNKAAALKYDAGEDSAPRLLAKGRNNVAEKIIEVAALAEIPIVEDAALVSALLALELGEEIPPDLYHAVAKILSFLYSVDKYEGGDVARLAGKSPRAGRKQE